MQLAAAGASVVAVDASEARLARLRENLGRTGLAAEIVAADVLDWEPGRRFEAVLLDAPCTATGTIRRHPDLPWLRDGRETGRLVALQAAMIRRAWDWVAPGGRLVYCVCSLLPEEGEAQAARFLADDPGRARRDPGRGVARGRARVDRRRRRTADPARLLARAGRDRRLLCGVPREDRRALRHELHACDSAASH